MKSRLENGYGKLVFKEPREPRVPRAIERAEEKFLKMGTMKISKNNERKEKDINTARKKLEIMNFEDRLLGKAKEKARTKRLDKKNKRGIYG